MHIIEWEKDRIEIPEIGRLEAFSGLNCTNVSVSRRDGKLQIEVPIAGRDAYDTIVRLDFAEPVQWDGVKAEEEDIYGLADGLG